MSEAFNRRGLHIRLVDYETLINYMAYIYMYNYSWHKINSNYIEFVLIYYTGYLENLFKGFEDIVP